MMIAKELHTSQLQKNVPHKNALQTRKNWPVWRTGPECFTDAHFITEVFLCSKIADIIADALGLCPTMFSLLLLRSQKVIIFIIDSSIDYFHNK